MAKRKSEAERKAEEVAKRLAAEREADRAARSERMRKVWAQRRGESAPGPAAERPRKPPPPARVQREIAKATAKPGRVQPTTPLGLAKAELSALKAARVKCTAAAVVRYPRDYEVAELRRQPILDDDGRRQYRQCEQWAVPGAVVCRYHGGASSQVLKRAEDQLKEARNPLMASLLNIALDERLSVSDRHKAITWALERAGFKGGVEIALELRPWERVAMEMAEADRAAFEAWRMKYGEFGSLVDEDDDSPDRTGVIEAEVVEPLTRAELNAAMARAGGRFEEETPVLDPASLPNFTPSSEAPPASWGLGLGLGTRQKRSRR